MGRAHSHIWRMLDGATLNAQATRAVTDLGAGTSLITIAACREVGAAYSSKAFDSAQGKRFTVFHEAWGL
ncbi:hypothetical protein IWW47_003196, partial [Coemansia sp. RSA 2052]